LEGVKTLSKAILKNKKCSIKSLYLDKNQIDSEACESLGNLLSKNNSIESLKISWNPIGDSQADMELRADCDAAGEEDLR